MIVIRVTNVGKMIPSALYESMRVNNGTRLIDYGVEALKALACKRMDNGEKCQLSDLCDIFHVDDQNNQVTIMRGDITIDDNGMVKYFE